MEKRIQLLLLLLYAVIMTAGAQNSPATAPCKDSLYVFRFVATNDMFYIPWKGNDRELARLTEMIEAYRDDILAQRIPVFVDGWCTSQSDRENNLRTAAMRSNRVKSELILRASLKESCFVTHNHVDVYEGLKDVVTVVLRVPVEETVQEIAPAQPENTAGEAQPKEPATPEVAKKEPGKQPAPQQKPQEAVSELPSALPPPETYCFAVRTNLLYDAFLMPTIGMEWRVNPDWGIKLDGSSRGGAESRTKCRKCGCSTLKYAGTCSATDAFMWEHPAATASTTFINTPSATSFPNTRAIRAWCGARVLPSATSYVYPGISPWISTSDWVMPASTTTLSA